MKKCRFCSNFFEADYKVDLCPYHLKLFRQIREKREDRELRLTLTEIEREMTNHFKCCGWCNEDFFAKNSGQIFCNIDCRNAFNKIKGGAYQHQYYANGKLMRRGKFSMRFDILQRDNFHCVYCGRGIEDGIKLQIDHIVPKSTNGTDTFDNLVTACNECNIGKMAKILKYQEEK